MIIFIEGVEDFLIIRNKSSSLLIINFILHFYIIIIDISLILYLCHDPGFPQIKHLLILKFRWLSPHHGIFQYLILSPCSSFLNITHRLFFFFLMKNLTRTLRIISDNQRILFFRFSNDDNFLPFNRILIIFFVCILGW